MVSLAERTHWGLKSNSKKYISRCYHSSGDSRDQCAWRDSRTSHTSATEDHQPQILEEDYRGRMNSGGEHWQNCDVTTMFDWAIKVEIHCRCWSTSCCPYFMEFYGFQEKEEQLRTELRVSLSSFTCSWKKKWHENEIWEHLRSLMLMLCFQYFLSWWKSLQHYLLTATVEHSFLKLKLVKT